MNVFVLCSGRCGSITFSRAAAHITNFTSGHESRTQRIGDDRFAFPDNHIEVDNRLSWLLGRLDEKFGREAFYVHLTRDSQLTAISLDKRWTVQHGIMPAYRNGILSGSGADSLDVCMDYVAATNANIRMFLKDKPNQMHFALESAERQWPEFWSRIGARGDLEASLSEWTVKHNATPERHAILSGVQRARALFFAPA
jgi:hypothetical protein